MVSHTLLDLFSQHDGGKADVQAEPRSAAPPPSVDDLLSEVERLGCRIDLVDCQPVIRANSAALTPSLLAMLKENRSAIIARLSDRAALAGPLSASIISERSGIRKDTATGKLHLFGNPSPVWLKKQGWAWDDRQRRFVATYPHDRADPRPCDMIGGGPPLPADYPEIIFEPQDKGAA
ncbi:MAG: hypothetical protein ABF916_07615 [Acetobacter fabarum]|uniref:hypothetical protein n=1 Tax=Acetobacter fabarum TaxID=483199 RepID=UPI0039ED06F0